MKNDYDGQHAKRVMPFGKHKGRTLGDIAEQDVLYLDWLNGRELHGGLQEAVRWMCEEYAREIERALDDEE